MKYHSWLNQSALVGVTICKWIPDTSRTDLGILTFTKTFIDSKPMMLALIWDPYWKAAEVYKKWTPIILKSVKNWLNDSQITERPPINFLSETKQNFEFFSKVTQTLRPADSKPEVLAKIWDLHWKAGEVSTIFLVKISKIGQKLTKL